MKDIFSRSFHFLNWFCKKSAKYVTVLLLIATLFGCEAKSQDDDRFVTYKHNLKKNALKFYWKDEKGNRFKSIGNLKSWLNDHGQTLLFAMNAGMYKPDHSPQGLYIEDMRLITSLDTNEGSGNFYMKPNGIFYITTNNTPVICQTVDFIDDSTIRYATQSGPMLLINGNIHPAFKQGSKNLNIRNGVGILPDNRVVFVQSKKEISFYDLASYFKSMGCINALYLDGLVSRTYLPEKRWIQTDGDFGVIIGISKNSD